MSDPVRVGVVGLGYWGPNIVRNLHELDQAKLVTVCDRDEERLALVGHRYPGVRRTTRSGKRTRPTAKRPCRACRPRCCTA